MIKLSGHKANVGPQAKEFYSKRREALKAAFTHRCEWLMFEELPARRYMRQQLQAAAFYAEQFRRAVRLGD
jgi:hypothetical protein